MSRCRCGPPPHWVGGNLGVAGGCLFCCQLSQHAALYWVVWPGPFLICCQTCHAIYSQCHRRGSSSCERGPGAAARLPVGRPHSRVHYHPGHGGLPAAGCAGCMFPCMLWFRAACPLLASLALLALLSACAELAGARQKDPNVNERTFHTWMNVRRPWCLCRQSLPVMALRGPSSACLLKHAVHHCHACVFFLTSLPGRSISHPPPAAGAAAGAEPRRGSADSRALGRHAGAGGAAA